MAVQKPIRTREFPASRVTIANGGPIVAIAHTGSLITVAVPYTASLIAITIPDTASFIAVAIPNAASLIAVAVSYTASLVAIADPSIPLIFTTVESFFAVHEGVRIFAELFPDFRMSLQELLQSRMLFNEILIVDQHWIFAELLRDFRMAVHEPIHIRQLLPRYIAIPAASLFAPVVPLLLPHEGTRVLSELFPDSGMLLQISLQFRMLLDELFVPDQRRILAQLFLEFRMTVKEFVHVGDLPPSSVVVLGRRVLSRHALSNRRRARPEHGQHN
jgi:hypothetical protein